MLASLIALLAVVSAPYTPSVYACDGVTATYTVNFPYLAKADVTATSTTAAGVATILSTSAYNLSVTSASVSATLTLNVPATSCPSGSTLTIARNEALTQPTSFRAQTSFNPALHEQAFDRLEMQIQQLNIAIPSLSSGQLLSGGILPAGSPGQFLSPNATSATGLAWVAGASAGSFTASGTGAVARPIPDKLSDVVSVKDYQAKGDGVTDDTVAIQAAITAAAGGGVYFPQPSVSYKVTGTINVSIAGTTLFGNSSKIFMAFTASGPSGGILFNVTASRVTFDGLWIDSTGTVNSPLATINHYAIQAHGTSGTHLTDFTVRRCTFTALPWADNLGAVVATHAVYASFVDGFTVQDSRFDQPAGAAVFMSAVTGFKVQHNNINNTGWYSIHANDVVTQGRISGNRITGDIVSTDPTVWHTRIWGGSINLMGNSTTGTHCGTPPCAQIKNVEVDHNYISGVHSYTSPVHIESASHIDFHNNVEENISLSPNSTFYPNGTPPQYIAVYVRPSTGTTNEGPWDHITIADNILTANGTDNKGIYCDAQDNGSGTLAYSDTLIVKGNQLNSKDSSNYFATAIGVHGQQGGVRNVDFSHNQVQGFPTSASPVSGLIGCDGLAAGPVLDLIVDDNTVNVVGGTSSISTHLGIGVARCQRVHVAWNHVNSFWNGIRLLSTASDAVIGLNHFNGSGSSDYLYSVGPTVTNGTPSVRFASFFIGPRGSALATTTVAASVPVGEYRVCLAARTTTSGTGTTATPSITWTDEGGAKTDTLATFALNAVDVTGQVNKCEFVHAGTAGGAATNIQTAVAGTFGTSTYSLSVTVEKLN